MIGLLDKSPRGPSAIEALDRLFDGLAILGMGYPTTSGPPDELGRHTLWRQEKHRAAGEKILVELCGNPARWSRSGSYYDEIDRALLEKANTLSVR